MPTTPKYGFPAPNDNDQPDVPADILALAEAVEDEIERVDLDVQDVSDAAEAAGLGWVPINHGSASSIGNLDIDLTDGGRFPAGTFHEIEITLDGSQDTAAVIICRVNNDSTAGLHRAGYVTWALSDGSVNSSESNTSTNRWKL